MSRNANAPFERIPPGRPGGAPDYADAAAAVARLDFGVASLRYGRIAESAGTDPVPALLAASAALAAKRPSDALRWLGFARRLVEDDVAVALLEQAALADLGEDARSQQVWLDIVRRHGRPDGTLIAGATLGRLRSALVRCGNSALLHNLLGDTAQAAGEWVLARTAYTRAISAAPRWTKPRVNFGVGLLSHGEVSEAIKVLEAGLKADPGNPRARLAFADAQLMANRPEAALRDYRKVANDPRWSTSATVGAGRANLALGRPDEAREAFRLAEKAAPGDPAPMIAMGEWYMRSADHRAAADAFASALTVAERGGVLGARASLLRLLIEARIQGGDNAGAKAALAEARSKEPLERALWFRLEARSHVATGEASEAEESLRAALESDNAIYPSETLRAIDAAGWTRKFVATYRTALEGFRTGVRGSAVDGRIVLQSVARSKAGEIRCLAVLGHLHRWLGEPGDEVSVRRELCRLRGNGTDWFLMGEAFERAGRSADARSSFREALVLGDLPPSAKSSALRRLEK